MPYATLKQLVDRVGEDTFNARTKGAAVLRNSIATGWLLTVSTKINAAARKGGYPVPIVAAALTDNTDLQAEITAWLVDKSVILVQVLFLQVLDSTEQIKAAQAWCAAELAELATGGGLPVPPPSDSLKGALVWVSQTGATDRLTPRTFRDIRRLPDTGRDNRRRLL